MGGIVGTDELYPAGETVALLAAREEAGPRRAASSGGLKPVTKRGKRGLKPTDLWNPILGEPFF